MAVIIKRRLLAILVLLVASDLNLAIPADWTIADERSPMSLDTLADV